MSCLWETRLEESSVPYRYKLIHGYHFPWDVPMMAFASGTGAILAALLESLLTIQPLWGMLLVAIGFDFLIGGAAARRERTLSIRVAEDRALTNFVIAGLSKFFYFLSDNAHHMQANHGVQAQSFTDAYPFGDWMALTCMVLVIRSIISHASVFGIKIPWLTDWLDKLSAKPPFLPPDNSNPAGPDSILGRRG